MQHAALAHLVSKVDSREGRLHWWRVPLENSGSMSKRHVGSDAEGSSAVELFRQLLGLECLCRIHSRPCFPESSQIVTQTVVSRHGVDTHERIGRASFQLD